MLSILILERTWIFRILTSYTKWGIPSQLLPKFTLTFDTIIKLFKINSVNVPPLFINSLCLQLRCDWWETVDYIIPKMFWRQTNLWPSDPKRNGFSCQHKQLTFEVLKWLGKNRSLNCAHMCFHRQRINIDLWPRINRISSLTACVWNLSSYPTTAVVCIDQGNFLTSAYKLQHKFLNHSKPN